MKRLLLVAAASTAAAFCPGQTPVGSTTPVIAPAAILAPTSLPPIFVASLQNGGGRMTTTATAQVSLAGSIIDGTGSRSAQITIQAPGYVSYRDAQNLAITFDGTTLKSSSGSLTTGGERILESLLAYFPDMLLLRIAAGGGTRRVGGHFRAPDGKTFWTLYEFSPSTNPNLANAPVLQAPVLIAIDEQTAFIDEVRIANNLGGGAYSVTQTQFNKWVQQNGQWYPSQIVRLENGAQVLEFDAQQLNIGAAAAPSAFQQ